MYIKVKAVDLTKENVIDGKHGSWPLPNIMKERMGGRVKFYDVRELPEKMSWKVGDEVWLNGANHNIKKLYRTLIETGYMSSLKIDMLDMLVEFLGFRFEDALRRAIAMIK